MWGKTDVYPYQRKNLELGKDSDDKKKLFSLPDGQMIKKMLVRVKAIQLDLSVFILAGCGFLLARAMLLGELLPFGLAFIGAAAAAKRNVGLLFLPVALGVVTVTQGFHLHLNLAVIGTLAAILAVYSQALERHWLVPAVAVFAVNFVIKAAGYAFIEPGIYFWVLALVESLLAGGITVLFTLVLTDLKKDSFPLDKLSPEEMAAMMVVCLGLVMGLGELALGELSLRAVVSKLVIMVGALVYGPGVGAIVGALVGVIPVGSSMMTPAFAGILAFSGVLAGVFRQFRKPGVIVGFMMGNLIFTVYLADQVTILHYLSETFLAGAILILLPPGWLNNMAGTIDSLGGVAGVDKRSRMVSGEEGVAKQRVRELGQIFREVARTFEESMPTTNNLDSQELIVGNVRNRLCQHCSRNTSCWGGAKGVLVDFIKGGISQLEMGKTFSHYNLPAGLQQQCHHVKELVLATQCSYDTWQVNNYWQRQLQEHQRMLPNQLKGISSIMEELAEKLGGAKELVRQWETRLRAQAQQRGVGIKNLQVSWSHGEELMVKVAQNSCQGKFHCGEIVVPAAAELWGKQFKVEKIKCQLGKDQGGVCQYNLRPYLQYKLTLGTAQLAKAGSPISGDSYSMMPLKDGQFALLLSDGMGSGHKAKLESNTTIALLEHLLESGFDRETAVATVNSILMLRNQEDSFATLDMAAIDLYSGQLEHTKIGAVPSFIKRGSQVAVINAGSLPIGILTNVDSITIQEQLQVGDIIIMITDGILDANTALLHKEQWIQDLLSKLTTDDPQEIAEQVLFKARVQGTDHTRDDMTILVARIDSRLH